jgi:hypothetical protein
VPLSDEGVTVEASGWVPDRRPGGRIDAA